MRLICPGCSAHYDVPDDAIPATGREVVCSLCDHVWMHAPAAADPLEADPIPPEFNSAPAVPDSPGPSDRRTLDAAVRAILQEEAARELERITAEKTKAALALPDTAPPAPVAGTAAPPPAPTAVLRAVADKPALPPAAPPAQIQIAPRGFRRGFGVMAVIVALALAPYLLAPQIRAAAPQLEAPLTSYTRVIDDLRLRLQQAATRAGDWLATRGGPDV